MVLRLAQAFWLPVSRVDHGGSTGGSAGVVGMRLLGGFMDDLLGMGDVPCAAIITVVAQVVNFRSARLWPHGWLVPGEL
jgi:hypothetical protein